ncbi:uncharacterized protein [Epargyreus clarus]|uniref:uncharacterized protein isoform X1 n=1 Tax=Epargyreus clarus TaxID=520877 RepID=UPI003C3072BF
MPTSGFDLYHMQDAKNNFDAMRPAPMYNETNQFMGQCHNVHVSTNCYYGYDGAKRTTDMQSIQNEVDCEMPEITELPCPALPTEKTSSPNNARKRSADDEAYPQKKRLKEEVMVPTTPTYSPCMLRPTHNNPDISRCLMVHMI